MAYSAAESWLMEEAADGNPVAVKAINARPEIEAHLQFIWEAFWEICADRPAFGVSFGPISFSAVDRYAARFGVGDIDEFRRFLRLIRRMDSAYLAHLKEATG